MDTKHVHIVLKTVELLIISPGIPHTYPAPHPVAKLAKEHNVRIISDIELFVSTYTDAKYIGITGTNGKTTMTNVIKKILTECGHKVGLIGTIQNEIGDKVLHTDNTTPMTYDYMALLDQMVKEKCDVVVMEVSSFGLVQYRTGPTHFDVSVFTNLTQDHLDYHGTMEEYYKAKNYDDALPNWRTAMKLCPPTASQNMLLNGMTLLGKEKEQSIKKNMQMMLSLPIVFGIGD